MESQLKKEFGERAVDLMRKDSSSSIKDGEMCSLNAYETDLKEKLKETDASKEIDYTFELNDVANFFGPDQNRRCSDPIHCFNTEFVIYVDSIKRNGKKYLELYLVNCNLNQSRIFSLVYKFTLLSHRPDAQPRVRKQKNTFDKELPYGCKNFISFDELKNDSAGFLVNDKIKVQVHLKVEKIKKK